MNEQMDCKRDVCECGLYPLLCKDNVLFDDEYSNLLNERDLLELKNKELDLKYSLVVDVLFGNKETEIKPKLYDVALTERNRNFILDIFKNGNFKGYFEANTLIEFSKIFKYKKGNKIKNLYSFNYIELDALSKYLNSHSGMGLQNADDYLDLILNLNKPMSDLLNDQKEVKDLASQLEKNESDLHTIKLKITSKEINIPTA